MTARQRQLVPEVRTAVAKYLEVSRDRVAPTSRLVEDLGADFLTMRQLALALEEAFDIEVTEAELGELRTVQEVTAYVDAKLRRTGGARGSGT